MRGSADSLLCLRMQKVLYMPVGLSCGHKVSMQCLPSQVLLVALPNSAAHHSATLPRSSACHVSCWTPESETFGAILGICFTTK